MERTEDKRRLNRELNQECRGYRPRDNKPDGAYIKVNGCFYNINKIKRLIERGANVNAKNYDGHTPLHMAVDGNNKEIAKLLIDLGADVGAKDRDGFTPLHLAVRWDNIDLAKLLIGSGADVGAKNNYGETPLHWAVDKRNIELVKLLIKAGATE